MAILLPVDLHECLQAHHDEKTRFATVSDPPISQASSASQGINPALTGYAASRFGLAVGSSLSALPHRVDSGQGNLACPSRASSRI